MKQFLITGDSSGLGKALVEEALKNSETRKVVGISRRGLALDDPRYFSLKCDLTQPSDLKKIIDEPLSELFKTDEAQDDTLIIINNAGMIGQISRSDSAQLDDLQNIMNVNVVSACLLMDAAINIFSKKFKFTQVYNINSGAGYNAYDGWAQYCTSKAALLMYANVRRIEIETDNQKDKVWITTVIPGIFDTPMQTEIRSVECSSQFSMKDKFIALKEEGELKTPQNVAQDILKAKVIEKLEVLNIR